MRDRAGVARWAHNPKVVGSNPSPATKGKPRQTPGFFNLMEFVVYILYSKKSKRNYTGSTSNLVQRFYSHNIFEKDSTRLYRPWIVVHIEFYESKEDATRKEKYYKSGSGSRLKQQIVSDFLARWAHTLPN